MPARGTRPVPSPTNGRDLRDHPDHVLRRDATLYRVHRTATGPWWFSRDGTGRFDLRGRVGTCSTAATDEGAFIEVFGRTGIIDPRDVASRSLAVLALDRDLRLADLASPAAAGFGVTATLSVGVPYDLHSQTWARDLWRAGFDGICHLLRHDPSGDEDGYALFGPGGASAGFGACITTPISADLLLRSLDRWDLVLGP